MEEQKTQPAEHIIAMLKGFLNACKHVPTVKVPPFKPSFYKDVLFYMEQINEDWLPIDYSQAESGKGCFDGKQHLVLINKKALCLARWDGSDWVLYIVTARPDGKVSTQMIHCSPSDVTHYRPIPTGWIGGV